jgi:anti-sigma factor RsiW
MKLQIQHVATLAITGLLGLGVVAGFQGSGVTGDGVLSAPGAPAEPLTLVQAGVVFSRTCATPRGICVLPQPAPVGSQCTCTGLGTGQVVR